MSRGAACPDEPPTEANQYQTRCAASGLTPIQPDGSLARICSTDVQKHAAWCMIRARHRLWIQAALATAVVAAVCYWLSRPLPGLGIAEPVFVPSVTTAIIALLLSREQAARSPILVAA